jgi:hypothetical protein
MRFFPRELKPVCENVIDFERVWWLHRSPAILPRPPVSYVGNETPSTLCA